MTTVQISELEEGLAKLHEENFDEPVNWEHISNLARKIEDSTEDTMEQIRNGSAMDMATFEKQIMAIKLD